ncbi:MAG: recombinase family protein [Chloroherpetonaceae bacterium]
MSGKRVGYIRVSTIDQNPDRQLEGITLDKKFIDYASGSSMKRPNLEAMLEYIREDDIVIVHSMDRLARNVKDLRNIIDDLVERKIKIQFLKENLTFSSEQSPMANLLLMVMGSIAEFELAIIRERQAEGIRIAKLKGKFKGRKKVLNNEKITWIKEQLEKTRKSKSKIAQEIGISRYTLYKYLPEILNQSAK